MCLQNQYKSWLAAGHSGQYRTVNKSWMTRSRTARCSFSLLLLTLLEAELQVAMGGSGFVHLRPRKTGRNSRDC